MTAPYTLMYTPPRVNCRGLSGHDWKADAWPIDSNWSSDGAVYIFARRLDPITWFPIYIGKTNHMNVRHANHSKELAARRDGATHILVLWEDLEVYRTYLESDLINLWKPALNLQVPDLLGAFRRARLRARAA